MLPVTPQPHDWSGVCVSIAVQETCVFSFVSLSKVVTPRIELSATRVSGGHGRPALDYHVVIQKVGHLGVEPRPSCSQSRRASICTCIRCCSVFAAVNSVGAYLPCQWAGRHDDNAADPFTECNHARSLAIAKWMVAFEKGNGMSTPQLKLLLSFLERREIGRSEARTAP